MNARLVDISFSNIAGPLMLNVVSTYGMRVILQFNIKVEQQLIRVANRKNLWTTTDKKQTGILVERTATTAYIHVNSVTLLLRSRTKRWWVTEVRYV